MARPMQVRINLPKCLKDTIELMTAAAGEDAGDAESIRSNLAILRQFSEHVDAVVRGEHTPKQLCELYCLVGPEKPAKSKTSLPADAKK